MFASLARIFSPTAAYHLRGGWPGDALPTEGRGGGRRTGTHLAFPKPGENGAENQTLRAQTPGWMSLPPADRSGPK